MADEVKDSESSPEVPLSPPLQDVVDMVNERPELTQEEWDIVAKATPWIKAQVRIEVRSDLEIEYAKRYEEQLEELKRLNKEHIDAQFDALKKAQEPAKPEDLKKLLEQEYTEFPVKLRVAGKDGSVDYEEKKFTICELPSSVEERFYKLLREALIPIMQERENIEFKLDQGSLIDKIQTLLEVSDKALDLGNALVAVILDPWKKDTSIDKAWVRNNISIERQAAIILAQFEANKYRDFFSLGFRSFLTLR